MAWTMRRLKISHPHSNYHGMNLTLLAKYVVVCRINKNQSSSIRKMIRALSTHKTVQSMTKSMSWQTCWAMQVADISDNVFWCRSLISLTIYLFSLGLVCPWSPLLHTDTSISALKPTIDHIMRTWLQCSNFIALARIIMCIPDSHVLCSFIGLQTSEVDNLHSLGMYQNHTCYVPSVGYKHQKQTTHVPWACYEKGNVKRHTGRPSEKILASCTKSNLVISYFVIS